MNDVQVVVEVEVNPTEDLEKVKTAITNFFPTASIDVTLGDRQSSLVATTEGVKGLAEFSSRLRQERILTAARRIFRRGREGNYITFYLNKQVAYVQRISFCNPYGESPLGTIEVKIMCENPKELIDWLTRDASRDRSFR
ncbi:MAG: hypothetical protein NWF13_08640 [Candidatus Bathyarchaeota archaeon]|nr:hypothetical protein [Candidatus Bathyarchaeota archaeon]